MMVDQSLPQWPAFARIEADSYRRVVGDQSTEVRFEDGLVKRRRRFSRPLIRHTVMVPGLTSTDLAAWWNWYYDHADWGAGSFRIVLPGNGAEVEAMFGGQVQQQLTDPKSGIWALQIQLTSYD